MSRVGKQPIKIPSGVTVKLNGNILEVNGSKGVLKRDTFGRVSIAQQNNEVVVSANKGEHSSAYWGLYRTLLSNMIQGVSAGFSKSLEIQGTGYRASMAGKVLNLTVGYSHPVNIDPPVGITFEVDKAGKVNITGVDKELVGQVAAKVRSVRPAEPYQGKGIRYAGEVIATKVGKSAGKK
ncbi:50S ribosomal protein L6 [Pigmentibacter sp. JX0631]|uniref:50S ribosomal protein L6 n=1 Tax=Pigmentibacter sp. JX0631 TaxID=2976982 RepID=UPI0024684380|nr:50S ribosomal protein L6 [Pigmentibacter sp. JX0631]WGL60748.1 50S ribosomal protein L6 [Pigmentibacter sp. JX0631]